MALVIEDGSVVESANTYVSVADVSSFCTLMNYTEWTSAPDTVAETVKKESAIIRSMQFFESLQYLGEKTLYDNPLEWPRQDVYLSTGDEFPNDEIPSELKKAVCEGAYIEYKTPSVLFEAGGSSRKIKFKKIDVLETEYFSFENSVPYPKLKKLVSKYLNSGLTLVRS